MPDAGRSLVCLRFSEKAGVPGARESGGSGRPSLEVREKLDRRGVAGLEKGSGLFRVKREAVGSWASERKAVWGERAEEGG